MSKALGFIRRYWYVPLVVILSGLLWFITAGRKANPVKTTRLELDVIEAGANVKKLEVELGTTRALHHVEARYNADLKAMDTKRRARAKELKADPVKLARFIVRGQG